MKYLLSVLALLLSTPLYAECIWSETYPIPNEEKLHFQECKAEGKIRIEQIELEPSIEFEIAHSNYPEGNSIWSVNSPDNKTAVVWIENDKYQRNAWVIDLVANEIAMFTDQAQGRHFQVEFDGADRFVIIHAGMGYRTDYYYEKKSGVWKNTGHKDIDVES